MKSWSILRGVKQSYYYHHRHHINNTRCWLLYCVFCRVKVVRKRWSCGFIITTRLNVTPLKENRVKKYNMHFGCAYKLNKLLLPRYISLKHRKSADLSLMHDWILEFLWWWCCLPAWLTGSRPGHTIRSRLLRDSTCLHLIAFESPKHRNTIWLIALWSRFMIYTWCSKDKYSPIHLQPI